jgi:L-amino acid N-acyltransferase YncA
MRDEDWPAVTTIFEEGIATHLATFETAAPSRSEWDAAHLAAHRLVAEEDGDVVGWAALGPYSTRACYQGVAEVSVYVAARARGRGVGRALLEALVAASERNGIWTLQAGVFPENRASLALHRRCGFRVVGVRERIGKLDGAWRDVVLLERRTKEIA